jgi:hypothetical protein
MSPEVINYKSLICL